MEGEWAGGKLPNKRKRRSIQPLDKTLEFPPRALLVARKSSASHGARECTEKQKGPRHRARRLINILRIRGLLIARYDSRTVSYGMGPHEA